METKSRYEVIAELERQKRELIIERDSFDETLIRKQKALRDLQRRIDDDKVDIEKFEKSIKDKQETIKELISSIDLSLQRLSLNQEKKK